MKKSFGFHKKKKPKRKQFEKVVVFNITMWSTITVLSFGVRFLIPILKAM